MDQTDKPDPPDFVLDYMDREVRVGDTIAYAVSAGHASVLSVGTVLDIVLAKTPSYWANQWPVKLKVQGTSPYNKARMKQPGLLLADLKHFVRIEA